MESLYVYTFPKKNVVGKLSHEMLALILIEG